MTTANVRSEWLYSSRFLRLTPIQRYSFLAALMWTVGEESDGYIGHDDIDLIPGFDRAAIPKLLEQRLVAETVGGWFVTPNGESFEASQTTKAQLEQCRKNNRERKARSRAKQQVGASVTELNALQRAFLTDDVPVGGTVGVPVGVTRDMPVTPQAKQSKAKTSKANTSLETKKEEKRATRVTPDYRPPDDVARVIMAETGATKEALRREHDKFIDYWRGKSGRDATKMDWDATWRNWMRNAAERGAFGGGAKVDKASQYLRMDNPFVDGGQQSALDC